MLVDAREASGISSQTHVYMDHVWINLWVCVLGVRTVRAMKIGLLFTHTQIIRCFPFVFLNAKLTKAFLKILLLEKAMATHSSTLAWNIPWTEEPGRLQSMGSLGVGHD